MLIINFGSGRSRTFVIQSGDGLKSMTVYVSVSDNSSQLEDNHRSCNEWSLLLSTCASTDWDKDTKSCSWRVCLSERSRRAKDNYIQFGIMHLLFLQIHGSLCGVNVSRSKSRQMGRDSNRVPLPGPVYWLLALPWLDRY